MERSFERRRAPHHRAPLPESTSGARKLRSPTTTLMILGRVAVDARIEFAEGDNEVTMPTSTLG